MVIDMHTQEKGTALETQREGKEGKGAEARQALINAALELIDEAGGCRGVTLRAVAARG